LFTAPEKCDSYGECAIKNTTGNWCYFPITSYPTSGNICDPGNPYTNVMAVHISLGVSNAYYTYDTVPKFFGTLDTHVPSGSTLFICSSGKDTDGPLYQTYCSLVTEDDSWGGSGTGVGECTLDLGQTAVTDGCYPSDKSTGAEAQAIAGAQLRGSSATGSSTSSASGSSSSSASGSGTGSGSGSGNSSGSGSGSSSGSGLTGSSSPERVSFIGLLACVMVVFVYLM
jgi:hypothetical protein